EQLFDNSGSAAFRRPDKALAAIRHIDGNVVGYNLPGGAALARAYRVEQLFDNSGSAAFRRPDKA
ncbi:hypothetical protein, partial [Klebsiella sp. GB_Kp056]|uniref:hypothetical protein n=1 Tax=Klebsiella sp. GB_Kp056 TaxID=3153405 RepID=UPI0032B4B433